MRFTRLLVLVGATALAAGACSSGIAATGDTAAPGPIRVVAGENVWGDILRQIGGSRVAVTSIISDPNTDPHEYESSVGDAAAVTQARLVVVNGVGYDDFLTRLLGASHPRGRTVLTVAHVVGVHGSNPNPHLWYQPQYVRTAARAFESTLASLDPDGAATFAANLRAFLAGEQQVSAVIDRIRAKYAGAPVGYTERVAGYLVDAAGLMLGSPEDFALSVEDGDDPSPLDAARFDAAITKHRIKVLLYNAQVSDTVTSRIRALATAHGVPVVGVTESLPAGQTYQTWQAGQARELLAALGG